MLKGFLVGLAAANAFEWFAHKYVLHGVHRTGKPRVSPVPETMKSHWEHHALVRKQYYYDHGYVEGWSNWRTRKEIASLGATVVVFTAISAPISKGFTAAVWYSAMNYYYVHRRSHLQPTWGKRNLPWHYDHHVNANQDANWCVTKPWFDYVMGTRVVSCAELKEQNPLGIRLPKLVSVALTEIVESVFPVKSTEHNQPIFSAKPAVTREKKLSSTAA